MDESFLFARLSTPYSGQINSRLLVRGSIFFFVRFSACFAIPPPYHHSLHFIRLAERSTMKKQQGSRSSCHRVRAYVSRWNGPGEPLIINLWMNNRAPRWKSSVCMTDREPRSFRERSSESRASPRGTRRIKTNRGDLLAFWNRASTIRDNISTSYIIDRPSRPTKINFQMDIHRSLRPVWLIDQTGSFVKRNSSSRDVAAAPCVSASYARDTRRYTATQNCVQRAS